MGDKLKVIALGKAGAVLGAACALLLTLLGNAGVYRGAMTMAQQWHMFYTPTALGTITGMVEGAVIGFLGGYAIAWLYNKFA